MSTAEKSCAHASPSVSMPSAAEPVCAQDHTLTEGTLDAYIRDCGHRMTAAMAAGDREDCEQWRQRMYEAINSRTPEHQARMHARIDAAIDSNWFQSQEALDLGRRPHA